MVTPVSQFIPGLTSSHLSSVDFFEPPISSDTSFLPQDTSWGKYASPALQAARFFLPSLDMLMIGSELFNAMIVSVIPNADTEESHTGRNVLIGGALCLGLLAMARFGFGGSKFKWSLATRSSGGPTVAQELSLGERILDRLKVKQKIRYPVSQHEPCSSDLIYEITIQHLIAIKNSNSRLAKAAENCLDGIENGTITMFSQVDKILSQVKVR